MLLRSVRRPLIAALLCMLSGAAGAQPKPLTPNPLTIEEIYSYEGWKRFNGSHAATMTWAPAGDPWLSDTQFLWPALSEAGGRVEGPFDSAQGRPADRTSARFRKLEVKVARPGVKDVAVRARTGYYGAR
jgi:hypothetical protein